MALLMSGKILNKIKERRQEKKAAKGNDSSFAEKALIKRFGDKFKKVTPAQKKQLITLFFSPIPPVTKRLLMARIIAKGAIKKPALKKIAKGVLRVATGGASIIAEKIAARSKARKEEAANIDNQESPIEDEMIDEAGEDSTVKTKRSPRGRARSRSRATSPIQNNGNIDDDTGDIKNISSLSTDKQIKYSQVPLKSGIDTKKLMIPALIGAGVLFFVMSKKSSVKNG